MVISTVASLGTAIGRFDRVCGHTGTTAITIDRRMQNRSARRQRIGVDPSAMRR
jgi:hypothetical protein